MVTDVATYLRVHRYLKRAILKRRVAVGAPVYLSAVLEYLCAEVRVQTIARLPLYSN